MQNNESMQFLIRVVREKHQSLITASNQLLQAISGNNGDLKESAAKAMLLAANNLRESISSKDVPDWLNNIIQYLTLYTTKQWDAFSFLSQHISLKNLIDTHTWIFEAPSEAAFDFDSIYERFKKESQLPSLFEQIVKILEDIESSGEVDSVTMLKGLGKVIATIKKGKDGSYFSLNGAWEFLMSFLKNYMWGELSKIPGLGTALEALKTTISETDKEMSELHQKIQAEMKSVVELDIKALKGKSGFPFITYTPTGSLTSDLRGSKLSASV